MGQPFKVLLSIGIIGILIVGNFSFLNKLASAETATTNGLVLYYSFDDNHYNSSGYNVKDWSGNDNDGIIFNHSNYSGNTLFGRAMTFDGEDDYIYINESSSLALDADLTIEVWVYWQGIQCQAIVQNPSYFGLYIMADGTIGIGDGLDIDISETAVSVESCKWTYISFTRRMLTENCAEMSIYIDGRLVCQCQDYISYILYDNKPTYIGCHGDDQNTNRNKYFNGIIDELKIYNVVKTPAEGMGRRVLDMAFEENNGNIAYDRSGMNLQGTISGANWDANGTYGGRCLDFDGMDDYVNLGVSAAMNIHDLTIEAWIYWEGVNQNQNYNTIISQYNHFWLYIDTNQKLCFRGANSEWEQPIVSVDSIPINNWTKVAVHRWEVHGNNPSTCATIFINGKSENTGNPSLSIDSPWETYVGCWGSTFIDHFFNGRIDNIQVYNSMNYVGCEVLRYQFETGISTEAKDESPYYNDGTLMYDAEKLGYYNCTPLRYGSCLKLNNSEGAISYIVIPNQAASTSDELDDLYYLTIEARIKWEPGDDYVQTIIYNCGDYWLYLDGNDTEKTISFINGDETNPTILFSTTGIQVGQWTYIAVTVTWDSQNWIGRIYINGRLDTVGTVDPSAGYDYDSPTYIGCKYIPYGSPTLRFNGCMDDIIVSNYAKTFHEDTDGDGMTDQYEIVRSVDSKEYNYLEYNGRYAILCAPVRVNKDNQFKYDITQMRYYLIANGWSDCDIIFLTCSDNTSRDNLSSGIASYYNGSWIDGEAYHDNLENAFEILKTGGTLLLKQSDESDTTYSFAQTSSRDIVFIEFRDHGIAVQGNTHYFCTYIPTNYSVPPPNIPDDNDPILASYWSTGNIDSELDNISAKYIILEIDMCYAGGWCEDHNGSVCGNNRLVLMSQDDQESYTYAYILYSRFWGQIFGSFVDKNGSLPLHFENDYPIDLNYSSTNASRLIANADGIVDILITNYTPPPCDNKEPYRNEECYWNSIISIKEAHYLAECACNDRFQYIKPLSGDIEQNPQIFIGDIISVSAPSIYL